MLFRSNTYIEQPGFDVKEADDRFQRHVRAWETMNRYAGSIQLLEKLIKECDLQIVDPALLYTIVEADFEDEETPVVEYA